MTDTASCSLSAEILLPEIDSRAAVRVFLQVLRGVPDRTAPISSGISRRRPTAPSALEFRMRRRARASTSRFRRRQRYAWRLPETARDRQGDGGRLEFPASHGRHGCTSGKRSSVAPDSRHCLTADAARRRVEHVDCRSGRWRRSGAFIDDYDSRSDSRCCIQIGDQLSHVHRAASWQAITSSCRRLWPSSPVDSDGYVRGDGNIAS